MRNREGMVRRGAAVSMAILCLCGISGCSSPAEKETQQKTVLELMVHKREDMESMGKLVDAFNRSQDEIVVQETIVPDVDTELRICAIEGNLPDLVQLNGLQAKECMEYVKGDYLLDLQDGAFMENVREELLPYIRYDGEIPLFPMTVSYEGIFVNTEKLFQAGYEIPDTYEALIQTARQIQANGETAFLFPDGENWSVRMSLEGIETAMRGSSADFWEQVALGNTDFQTDTITLEAIRRMKEIRQYGQEDALETGYDEAVERFAAGEAYFFPQGSWCYQALIQENTDLQVQLIPFPVSEEEEQKVTFWIDSNLAVTSQSEYPEEAAVFLDFVSKPENLEMYTESQQTFGCVKGTEQMVPYADCIDEMEEQGALVYEAVGLPQAVSCYRDERIPELLIRSGDEAVQEYLTECTKLLREYGQEYLSMKEKTG